MKKIAEKVALVAQICIALVFVLTTALYMTGTVTYYNSVDGVVDNVRSEENGILSVLMLVLAIVFVGVSVYLLYINFSKAAGLKRILLFCDSQSATLANLKVLQNITRSCAKNVDGLKVNKIRISSDEKGGLVANVFVNVTAEKTAQAVNALRELLEESFRETLGLSFNTMNFTVEKIGHFVPTLKSAPSDTK